jgi:predicted nucleic acid-binding protein
MLLDTSGLLCYHHLNEPEHVKAQTLFEQPGLKVTHNYVLAEFIALVQARRLPRRNALDFITALAEHPEVEILWVNEALHQAAVQLLEARLDKAYSLCDAVSFVVMKHRRISVALTTDRHFEQEGFQKLL